MAEFQTVVGDAVEKLQDVNHLIVEAQSGLQAAEQRVAEDTQELEQAVAEVEQAAEDFLHTVENAKGHFQTEAAGLQQQLAALHEHLAQIQQGCSTEFEHLRQVSHDVEHRFDGLQHQLQAAASEVTHTVQGFHQQVGTIASHLKELLQHADTRFHETASLLDEKKQQIHEHAELLFHAIHDECATELASKVHDIEHQMDQGLDHIEHEFENGRTQLVARVEEVMQHLDQWQHQPLGDIQSAVDRLANSFAELGQAAQETGTAVAESKKNFSEVSRDSTVGLHTILGAIHEIREFLRKI